MIGEKKAFIRLQGLQEVERGVLASIASLGRAGSGGANCSDYSYFDFIHLTYSSENIMIFVGGRAQREGAEEHLQGRPGEVLTAGWQKLNGSTGGTRRKVWTRTKILSPNKRYFVAN